MTARGADVDRVDGRPLFGHIIEDIRFMKRNQWMISNYGASLQVALIALYRFALAQSTLPSMSERVVFSLLAALAAAGAISILVRFQKSLAKYRARVDLVCAACTECPERPKEVVAVPDRRTYQSFWKDGSILILLSLVQCFGAAAVLWVVWR